MFIISRRSDLSNYCSSNNAVKNMTEIHNNRRLKMRKLKDTIFLFDRDLGPEHPGPTLTLSFSFKNKRIPELFGVTHDDWAIFFCHNQRPVLRLDHVVPLKSCE